MRKAGAALDDAFLSAAPDEEALFALTITKTWLRQVIVGLALICHSSYRGVVEFLRDLLGISISVGTVHQVLQFVTQKAGVLKRDQDLSGIRVGLHDEIFHDGKPVLAGVDAASTYCYLLVAAQHRDADTWGVHLLDATEQGLKPDYTIADAGQGLRAGQKAAWGDTPCHGDVFHIQRQCESLANTLSRLAKGATSRRKMLQAKIERAGQRAPDDELGSQPVALVRQAEAKAHWLARDIRTLIQWLSHDVLALAGPMLATRQVLFDFVVEELSDREVEDARRIRPLRIALQNQRNAPAPANQLRNQNPALKSGGFRSPVVTQKWPNLNHAVHCRPRCVSPCCCHRGRCCRDPRRLRPGGRAVGRYRVAKAVPGDHRQREGAGTRSDHRRVDAAASPAAPGDAAASSQGQPARTYRPAAGGRSAPLFGLLPISDNVLYRLMPRAAKSCSRRHCRCGQYHASARRRRGGAGLL
jgi:hypothetical protein